MSTTAERMLQIRLPLKAAPRLSIDPVLVLLTAALLAFGLTVLASASIGVAEQDYGAPFFYVIRQLQAIAIGLAAATALALCPMSAWQHLGPMLLLFALALLVFVLVPGVGNTVNGATRWVSMGGITVQVSEPARLALLLYLAGYAVRQQDALQSRFGGLLRPMLVLILAAALMLAEPDFGAATVLVATGLVMLFVAGARLRDIAVWVLLGVAAFIALAVSVDYRARRLSSFLNPWADPLDTGFQLTQSLIAIGRGEWFGVGLGDSVQKQFYLPEAHTDFVFAVFAEEFGLFGTVALIALVLALVWRIVAIARRAAERGLWFQAHVAVGIAAWLGMQSFINIGVNTGLLPTKGLTLPLVSYGRSSMIVVLAAIGLALRVHHETETADERVTGGRR